ncbi:class I SAM-dependent methyltransferase [Streptomyces sp. NPDC001339]|uniref:class I SAM-dependent methyltransferase n=1 Tax=Streptomyces sp. NPDC001339 TaxID=3364563 RepID=UPI0036D03515
MNGTGSRTTPNTTGTTGTTDTEAHTLHLTKEKETLLATLYGRALDSRAKQPILGDSMAVDTVRRIHRDFHYDFRKMRLNSGDAAGVALRARQLDIWTAGFLARHEQATVVHLGCGLDTRIYRLDPGPGVRWFDIDYPEVIELRRKLLPQRAGYTTIPSSVTDPAWVEQIPSDQPTMIVAEGLLVYLTEEEGTALLRRLMAHAPSGELAFDAFSPLAIRTQWLNRVVMRAGARLHWGTDTEGIARLSPRLRIVENISMVETPEVEKLPAASRLMARTAARIPAVRDMGRMYHCTF